MRRWLIYGLLAATWLMVAGWQAVEHRRVSEFSQRGLASRAHDLSAALSVVIRSQGRTAFVPKPRLEAALDELIRSTELDSVLLLNASGEVAASAGEPMTIDPGTLLRTHEYWTGDTASFANLVALGPGVEDDEGGTAIILPMDPPQGGEGRGPRGGPGMMSEDPETLLKSPFLDAILDPPARESLLGMLDGPPLTSEQTDSIIGLFREGALDEHRTETLRRMLTGRPLDRLLLGELLLMTVNPMHRRGPPRMDGDEPGPPGPPHEPRHWMRGDGRGRPGGPPGPPPEQPPWMNKDEYDRLVEEHGVHWFLVTMPTAALHSEMARDLRLRGIVLGVALLACLALGMAWRTLERSSSLEIQLVRARETARRLEELNVTAAGLVHETKNPLNIIRGLAQMIGRESGLPGGLRDTALKITEETDRVTGRLNQFLDYARPAQPHPQPLDLHALVNELFGILAYDREEKSVTFELTGPPLSVQADENMLRQVLFNLLINAVQAVPDGGHVEVRLAKESSRTVCLDVRDDGPGVSEENRDEVFRPYFTTTANGTGLGLAVVRQIALAHGWEAACMPNQGGAVFRIGGIALAPESAQGAERG